MHHVSERYQHNQRKHQQIQAVADAVGRIFPTEPDVYIPMKQVIAVALGADEAEAGPHFWKMVHSLDMHFQNGDQHRDKQGYETEQ
jgi:hypothetical protein